VGPTGKNEWNDIKEIDEFVERLKKNEVTYVYQKHSRDRLVFPYNVEKTPDFIQEDFEEAAAILDQSPRGATASVF
jgi:hypothetical protein